MASFQRYLFSDITHDIEKKMVFVGGPRQVGKTTLGKSLLPDPWGYINWDVGPHRDMVLRRRLPPVPFLFFDEIHKYRGWRNYLKGLYDARDEAQRILLMGSARLDFYRFGGDSLQGRYHYYRMHPLSLAELGGSSKDDLLSLLTLGGFPEPFFSGSEKEAQRWSVEYRQRLIREDVTGLEQIHDLAQMELLALRLPELVGAPLSVNAVREDIQTSHKTVSRWLRIFEQLYVIFRIPPFGPPRVRAVKKEQKHYHLDWTVVPSLPLRFENLVACHLKKWVDHELDSSGRDLELRYFRDVHGHEVDFVVLEKRQPIRLIECKWGDADINPSLKDLFRRYPKAEAWQISATGTQDYRTPEGLRVSPARLFLKGLV